MNDFTNNQSFQTDQILQNVNWQASTTTACQTQPTMQVQLNPQNAFTPEEKEFDELEWIESFIMEEDRYSTSTTSSEETQQRLAATTNGSITEFPTSTQYINDTCNLQALTPEGRPVQRKLPAALCHVAKKNFNNVQCIPPTCVASGQVAIDDAIISLGSEQFHTNYNCPGDAELRIPAMLENATLEDISINSYPTNVAAPKGKSFHYCR